MGNNDVSVRKYLSDTLKKTIATIGVEATVELLQEGQGLFKNHEYKIINTICKEFNVSIKKVLSNQVNSTRMKLARNVICFFLIEYGDLKLKNVAEKFNPPKSIPSICKYAKFINELSPNINEHIMVTEKINRIKIILKIN